MGVGTCRSAAAAAGRSARFVIPTRATTTTPSEIDARIEASARCATGGESISTSAYLLRKEASISRMTPLEKRLGGGGGGGPPGGGARARARARNTDLGGAPTQT